MLITGGTVVDGKVVVEGDLLADGTRVTVLVPDREESFAISAAQKAELQVAIAQAERGEVITPSELYERLDRI